MADSINTFSEDAIRSIVRQVYQRMRATTPSRQLQRKPSKGKAAETGVPFVNDSGYEVPPYGVMEVVSIDNDGTVRVTRPTGRREQLWLVNQGTAVADGASGRGEWGLDGPVPVLSSGHVDTYYDDDRHVQNRSFAPRAGYWHLRSDNDGGNPSDANTEDFGFRRVSLGGVTLSSAAYNYGGDSTLGYVVAKFFVQQIESPELSIVLPLDNRVYNNSWSVVDDLSLTPSTLKLRDDYIGLQFSRIGFRTIDPTISGDYPIRFFRSGTYRVDLFLAFSFKGNDYASLFNTTTETAANGTPPHTHQYHKMKADAFNPAFVDVSIKTATGRVSSQLNDITGSPNSTIYLMVREPFFFVGPDTSSYLRTFHRYLSVDLRVSGDTSPGYDPNNADLSIAPQVAFVGITGTGARMDQSLVSGQDADAMFLRITRVAEKWRMEE